MSRLIDFCSMIYNLKQMNTDDQENIKDIFNKYRFNGEYIVDKDYGCVLPQLPLILGNELKEFKTILGNIDKGFEIKGTNDFYYSLKYNKEMYCKGVN